MFQFSCSHKNKWHLKKRKEKKDFWVHCRPKGPSHTADQSGVLLSRAILPLYARHEKLSLHGKPNLNHWSKRLPRQGLENTAVQRLQFPGNRAAFVSNRSPRITVTGVPTAEETRAKPLADAGSGQCCHHNKAPMDKIKPLRTARGHTQHFHLQSLKFVLLLILFKFVISVYHICSMSLLRDFSPTSIASKIPPLCISPALWYPFPNFFPLTLILQPTTGNHAVFFHQSPLKILQHLLNWVSNLTKNINC